MAKSKYKYDFLIVGAGLFGATFSRLATDAGYKCLIIDKRPHTGGNIYCDNIEGINVHKYGAHIFHTSDRQVWNFVNQYIDFNRYTNSPIAVASDGNIYNLPFNMNTFNRLWGVKTPQEAIKILSSQRNEAIENLSKQGVEYPRNLEEQALSLVGKDIYHLLIEGYTRKQWGRNCSELPAFIIRRLPVRLTYDNNYFNDLYQGIPIGGYNPLIKELTKGAYIQLNTDWFDCNSDLRQCARMIIFTGSIDQYYDYRFGKLEYRTVSFDTKVLDTPNYQGNAVVNYISSNIPYTRIIEHKHFETFGDEINKNSKTVISKEFPCEWTDGLEPYYPVNNLYNTSVYEQYSKLAAQEKHVYFGGRLGEYKYYDMAPTIARAITMFNEIHQTTK